MKKNRILLFVAVSLCGMQSLGAQSLFDMPMFSMEGQRRSQEKNIKFDYNADFQYFLDVREFGASKDLFTSTETLNLARLTPSVSLTYSQNREITHRLAGGIDVIKNLGENPITNKYYSENEDNASLLNTHLFKELLFYYNLHFSSDRHIADLYAGIFPRAARSGYYSRAMFSDYDMITNPNIEGFIAKYESRKFIAEAGMDRLGMKGIDRRPVYMAFTSGTYKPFRWASIGWDGTYTNVGRSIILAGEGQSLIMNPYLKFEAGHLLGLQDLSVRAGGMISYQHYSNLFKETRFPMGAEVVSHVRHWNVGIENTLYFGDNIMILRNPTYVANSWAASAYNMLYRGEPFYYTRKGYASVYDRLELYWQPSICSGLDMKVSAVAHFIDGTSTVKPFLGYQAKASLIFNIAELRHPSRHIFGNTQSKKTRTAARHDGPSIRL